MHTKVA